MMEIFITLLILKLEGIKISWKTVFSPIIAIAVVGAITFVLWLINRFNG